MPKKYSIELAHELASQNGGQCLSTQLTNSITKLKWKCTKGHHFVAKLRDVTKGAWCDQCK